LRNGILLFILVASIATPGHTSMQSALAPPGIADVAAHLAPHQDDDAGAADHPRQTIAARRDINSPLANALIWAIDNPVSRAYIAWTKQQKRFDPSQVKRILLLSFAGVGDAVMYTSMVAMIRQRFPNARLTLLTTPMNEAIFRHNPNINDVIIYSQYTNRGIGRLFAEIWATIKIRLAGRYDLCALYPPCNGTRHKLIAFFAGVRHIIAPTGGTPYFDYVVDEMVRVDPAAHVVERAAQILRDSAVGIPSEMDSAIPGVGVYLTAPERNTASAFFNNRNPRNAPVIGMHIGCKGGAYGIHRRWPQEMYLDIVQRIRRDNPARVIILFKGPHDTDIDYSGFARLGCVVAEGLSLRETAAIIEQCELFIGNDSGLGHIAAGVGTPTVTIFGPTNPDHSRPYHDRSACIRESDCPACWEQREEYLRACNGRVDCIRQLTPNIVYRTIQQAL